MPIQFAMTLLLLHDGLVCAARKKQITFSKVLCQSFHAQRDVSFGIYTERSRSIKTK